MCKCIQHVSYACVIEKIKIKMNQQQHNAQNGTQYKSIQVHYLSARLWFMTSRSARMRAEKIMIILPRKENRNKLL